MSASTAAVCCGRLSGPLSGDRTLAAIAVALVLTVLTGFTGLVYEVTWQKYLAVLLGSHSEATAAVLAIFLGGLSVGYSLFGRVTRQVVTRARARGEAPRLLGLYGLVEAGIGVWVLLFPLLFGAAQAVSWRLPHALAGVAFGFDVAMTVLLIGPPTVLMGGTIPILTQALARSLEDSTRVHAWVYASNTAGAFAGAFAAGFFLVDALGLDGVLFVLGFVNLGAGAVFLWLGRRRREEPPEVGLPAGGAAIGVAPYAVVALLAGFAMMTVQTVLNRIGGLSFGASHYTFAMVVAAFVLCIALGSFAVSALRRIPPSLIVASQWALVFYLALLYRWLPDGGYWAHVWRALFRDIDQAFLPYFVSAFALVLLVLAIPIGLSGALLPLLFHHLRRETDDMGGVAGRLYGWNTLGSLLGALVSGYVLLLWLDLDQVFRIALVALALGAAILTVRVLGASRLGAAFFLGVVVAGIALQPAWSPDRLAAGLFRFRAPTTFTFQGPDLAEAEGEVKVVFYDDDPSVSVAVKEASGEPMSRAIVTEGKPDSALFGGDRATTVLLPVLAALFAAQPERAFVVGYGTGVTTGTLAALEEVREVEVAEISRGVLRAAPLFEQGNFGASQSPKVRLIRSDAYRALLRSEGEFDVIVSEPSNPWRVGVEMLYSREFLRAALSRLAPGGVYVQWFHLYETDLASVELVMRTYVDVFRHVGVWYTVGPDVLLLGFEDDRHALDVERLVRRAQRPDFRAALAGIGIDSPAALLAHELIPVGPLEAARLRGPVHTLRHPILSHQAARAFFRGAIVDLPKLVGARTASVGTARSLLRRFALGSGGFSEDVYEKAVRETCGRHRALECASLVSAWRHDHPGSARERATTREMRGSRDVAPHLQPRILEQLVSLRRGGTAGFAGTRLEKAVAAEQRFHRYYHYAVPFDTEALLAFWDRCLDEPGSEKACRAGRPRLGGAAGQ